MQFSSWPSIYHFYETLPLYWHWVIVFAFLIGSFMLITVIKFLFTPVGIHSYKKPINILSWWKKYFHPRFQDFLSKYDGTALEEVYAEESINREEAFPRQMLLLYLFIDLVAIFGVARLLYFLDPRLFSFWHPLEELIKHIDMAGIFNGFLATILAIIIARIVEIEQKNERNELKQVVVNIQTATSNIETLDKQLEKEVNHIITSFTALQPKHLFEERLQAQERILKMANKNRANLLYYMSFSVDFGHLRSRNLGVLLEEYPQEGPSMRNLKNVFSHFQAKTEKLYTKLKHFCQDRPNHARFAFLNTSTENATYKSAYQRYIERVLDEKTAELVPWNKDNLDSPDEKAKFEGHVERAKKEKSAFYIQFDRPATEVDRKAWQQEIIEKNRHRADELIHTEATVKLLDRMSFQFMMTTPGTDGGVRNRNNECCLVIFSNIDAIGDNAGVYAFESTDTKVIDNLKRIYEVYCQQQEERDNQNRVKASRWNNFRKLFDIGLNRKRYNILKVKQLSEVKAEMIEGVALADIQSAVHIQSMFKDNDEAIPPIQYSKPFDDNYFRESGTYFAIGLFGEGKASPTLAEYVGQRHSGSVLTFQRRNPDDPEAINVLTVNRHDFFGHWSQQIPEDFAMVAKIKAFIRGNEITFIIVGGINHLGTERISEYLETNWQELHRQSEDLPFIVIYKINDDKSLKNEEQVKRVLLLCTESGKPDVWVEKFFDDSLVVSAASTGSPE